MGSNFGKADDLIIFCKKINAYFCFAECDYGQNVVNYMEKYALGVAKTALARYFSVPFGEKQSDEAEF